MASKRKHEESSGNPHYKDLEQVEAALLIDPENEDLLKLRNDLEELIRLSEELDRKERESALRNSEDMEKEQKICLWRVGEKCLAKWSDSDRQFYEATINTISYVENTVQVTFTAFQNRVTLSLNDIRVWNGKNDEETERKKRLVNNNPNKREYIMKRKLKKQQKLDTVQSECEKEKNKWLKFRSKVTKTAKRESIFATTDNVNGRVGIGTCGTSGKPMTGFVVADKMKKVVKPTSQPAK